MCYGAVFYDTIRIRGVSVNAVLVGRVPPLVVLCDRYPSYYVGSWRNREIVFVKYSVSVWRETLHSFTHVSNSLFGE